MPYTIPLANDANVKKSKALYTYMFVSRRILKEIPD